VSTSHSVTLLNVRNNCIDLENGLVCHRWIPVRVIDFGPPCLVVDGDNRQLQVKLATCRCGEVFALWGMDWSRYCRTCDTKRLAEAQRQYRQRMRKKSLRLVCGFCGSKMEPKRRSKKFCTPQCRVSSFRKKVVTSDKRQRAAK
jgi:hypothetical protein